MQAQAGEDVWVGAGSIIGFHQLKAMFDELGPRLEGQALVASYGAKLEGGMVPLLGIGAALAVPAFIGYVRRSKTTEVATNFKAILAEMQARQASFLASAPRANKKKLLAQIKQMRIARTPAQVPCGEKHTWTPEELEYWKPIFAPQGGTLYSYEVGPPKAIGTQKEYPPDIVLLLKATGDLDCDQKQSTFEMAIGMDPSGQLIPAPSASALYINDEVE